MSDDKDIINDEGSKSAQKTNQSEEADTDIVMTNGDAHSDNDDEIMKVDDAPKQPAEASALDEEVKGVSDAAKLNSILKKQEQIKARKAQTMQQEAKGVKKPKKAPVPQVKTNIDKSGENKPADQSELMKKLAEMKAAAKKAKVKADRDYVEKKKGSSGGSKKPAAEKASKGVKFSEPKEKKTRRAKKAKDEDEDMEEEKEPEPEKV